MEPDKALKEFVIKIQEQKEDPKNYDASARGQADKLASKSIFCQKRNKAGDPSPLDWKLFRTPDKNWLSKTLNIILIE